MFLEYLEAHGKDAIKILEKVSKSEEDSGVEIGEGMDDETGHKENSTDESQKEKSVAANDNISDLEVRNCFFFFVFFFTFWFRFT